MFIQPSAAEMVVRNKVKSSHAKSPLPIVNDPTERRKHKKVISKSGHWTEMTFAQCFRIWGKEDNFWVVRLTRRDKSAVQTTTCQQDRSGFQ